MSLDQHIVVVNEYTVKGSDGQGSRGSRMDKFAERYMNRDSAIEPLSIGSNDLYAFGTEYMGRLSATESLDVSSKDLSPSSGASFGMYDISFTEPEMKRRARSIQKAFDKGKTVLKTVVSFDEAFLSDNNLLSKSFVNTNEKGMYRYMVDQIKLRSAVQMGLRRLSSSFDKLDALCCIQTDTKHVHVHILMLDRGQGRIASDGTQKGKLSKEQMDSFRRGMFNYLDRNKHIEPVTLRDMQKDKSVEMYVKYHIHRIVENRQFVQFMFTLLPENKRMWRYKSNAKVMKKANKFLNSFVNVLLNRKDSGFKEYRIKLMSWVSDQIRRGVPRMEAMENYEKKLDLLNERLVNNIYRKLSTFERKDIDTTTPFLTLSSENLEEVQIRSEKMVSFLSRLQSFTDRLERHKERFDNATMYIDDYKSRKDASEDSKSALAFFEKERDYHLKMISKYSYFVSFLPVNVDNLREQAEELHSLNNTINSAISFSKDLSVARMKDKKELESYGRNVYGIDFGDLFGSRAFDAKVKRLKTERDRKEEEFNKDLDKHGLDISDNGSIVFSPLYGFHEVKALDLHDLFYDFDYDFEVNRHNLEAFFEETNERIEVYRGCVYYFEHTKQDLTKLNEDFEVDELQRAFETMKMFNESGMFQTKKKEIQKEFDPKYSLSLDNELGDDLKNDIKSIINEQIRSLQDD